jgi:hypothetical protein
MNSKFLYAATIAVSLISTLAMADETTPVTREQVVADLHKAIADGTLQRTDYDVLRTPARATGPLKTRAQVNAEFAADKTARSALVGPEADRNYNPNGTQIFETSTLTRNEVKAEVLQAAANGTLQRTDYDDPTQLARQAKAHEASASFAQRLKAKFSGKQS